MSSPRSQVAVVYNPVKVDVKRLRRAVAARARRHGWLEPIYLETTTDDPGQGMAAEATAHGVGLVIAVGGDGTVRAVASGLGSGGPPMGIVPCGTGNLLARNLQIPLDDLDAALGIAMGGRTRPIDTGTVEFVDGEGSRHEEVFLVIIGAGMDADMIAGTDDQLKARVGWAAYVGAFARTVLRGHRIKVSYAINSDPPRYSHTRTLLVANCGTLQGGMVLIPDAKIDDGQLDVLVLRVKGLYRWVQALYVVLFEHTFLHHLARGRRRRGLPARPINPRKPLDLRQGTTMSAKILEKPAAFQVDGEMIGTVTEFTARIAPRALSVRVHL